MGRLVDKFIDWALQKRRWPLLFPYLGIPGFFAFDTFYWGLSSLNAVGDQFFLMGCGVLLVVSGILYPAIWPPLYPLPQKVRGALSRLTSAVLRERSRRLWVGGFLALAGLLLAIAGNVPPPISDDPLVVGIAKFTPVGGAEREAQIFKDSLISKLNKKEEDPGHDRPLLKVTDITSEVKGTMTEERIRFGKRLGVSWTTNVHILVGGRVRSELGKEKPGTYVAPYVAFVRPLRHTHIDEKEIQGNFQAEPELIEFPAAYAGNITDLALFIYGLAHYRAQDWNRAIEILSSVDSNPALFYKALCLQERAKQAGNPKQDLEDAVSAYRSILGNDPWAWKITDGPYESEKLTHAAYYNGANAMAELALFSPPQYSSLLLEVARDLYERAVAVRTREKDPLEWAWVQNNLGNVLVEFGTRVNDGRKELQEAVKAYDGALQVYAQPDEQWAATQNNLGTAFINRGSRQEGVNQDLQDAVTAYNQAIHFYKEKGLRQDWAMACTNLGYALTVLGSRKDDTDDELWNAVEACEKALLVRTLDTMPAGRADTQNTYAYALRELGNRLNSEEGTQMLQRAKNACNDALGVYNEKGSMNWAMTKDNLGRSLCDLGVRLGGEDGKNLIREAWAAHLEAANVNTQEYLPQRWAYTQSNIGKALLALSTLESGSVAQGHLDAAVVKLEDAQSFYFGNYPAQYKEITALLCLIRQC